MVRRVTGARVIDRIYYRIGDFLADIPSHSSEPDFAPRSDLHSPRYRLYVRDGGFVESRLPAGSVVGVCQSTVAVKVRTP